MAILITKPLADHQADAITIIDTLAGEVRLKYITSIPGQDATYVSKKNDALAYKAAGYPADATPYPWVLAEYNAVKAVNSTVTLQQTADGLLQTASQWDIVGSKIEQARRTAKNQIPKTPDYPAVLTVLTNYKTALSTL